MDLRSRMAPSDRVHRSQKRKTMLDNSDELNCEPEEEPPKAVPATPAITKHNETYEQIPKMLFVVQSRDGETMEIYLNYRYATVGDSAETRDVLNLTCLPRS